MGETHRVLVGSYTDALYILDFTPPAPGAPGKITHINSITVGHHPSWIAPHPRDPALVFAGLEQPEGKIVAVRITPDKAGGEVVAEADSGGAHPCHFIVDGDHLIIANYSSGTVATLPISTSPPYILAPRPTSIVQTYGSGPNTERQGSSHPHMAYLHPDPARRELLIPDLGADTTWRLVPAPSGEAGAWAVAPDGHVRYTPGSGPRHLLVHRGVLYTLLELQLKLTVHALPPLPAPAAVLSTTSTLTDSPVHGMIAAELLTPADSEAHREEPVLYATNRNDPHPDGDPLTIFVIAPDGVPTLTREVRTGLAHIRGAALGPVPGLGAPGSGVHGQGRWLIVGGTDGGGVKMYARKGAELEEVAALKEVERPTAFLWL